MVGVIAAAVMVHALVGSPRPESQGQGVGIAPGSLAAHGDAIRWIVGIGAVLAFGSAILTLRVREPAHRAEASAKKQEDGPPDPPSSAFVRVVCVMGVFSIANGSDAFILLRLADIGMSPWLVVAAYALFNLVYELGSYPAGVLSDRIGRRSIMVCGWVVYAGVYGALAMMTPDFGAWRIGAWGLMALYGAYTAMTDGVGKALAADVAPRHHRGRAMGMLAMVMGLGSLVGSVITGALWHQTGPHLAFGVSASVAVVAAILGVIVLPPGRRAVPR